MKSVYSAVRTGALNRAVCSSSVNGKTIYKYATTNTKWCEYEKYPGLNYANLANLIIDISPGLGRKKFILF